MSEDISQPPPMPPESLDTRMASLGPRFIALVMDCLLVGAVAVFLLVKILLPQEHPEGMEALSTAMREYQAAVEEAMEADTELPAQPDLTENEAILSMAAYIQQTLLIVFFLYFGNCEWFLRGSTLGKRTFGLRSVMLGTVTPPTPLQGVLRGAIKAFALVGYPPISCIILLMALFVSGRRGGHDLLTRTMVVRDYGYKEPPKVQQELA